VLLDPVDYTAPYVERTASGGTHDANISCLSILDEKILKEKTETNEKAKQFLKNSIKLVSASGLSTYYYTIHSFFLFLCDLAEQYHGGSSRVRAKKSNAGVRARGN